MGLVFLYLKYSCRSFFFHLSTVFMEFTLYVETTYKVMNPITGLMLEKHEKRCYSGTYSQASDMAPKPAIKPRILSISRIH